MWFIFLTISQEKWHLNASEAAQEGRISDVFVAVPTELSQQQLGMNLCTDVHGAQRVNP